MSDLNLPDGFRDMEQAIQQRKRDMFTADHFELSFDVLEKVLTALSEARDKVDEQEMTLNGHFRKTQKLREEIDTLKAEARKG